MRKRVLSLCMALAMCLSLLPLPVIAAETAASTGELLLTEVAQSPEQTGSTNSGTEEATEPDTGDWLDQEIVSEDVAVISDAEIVSEDTVNSGAAMETPSGEPVASSEEYVRDEETIPTSSDELSTFARPQNISVEDMIAANASVLTPLAELADGESATLLASNANILLIQTNLPWESNANTQILGTLKSSGYLDSYDVVTMENAPSVAFSRYNVVMFANDQTVESYKDYELIRVALEDYIYNGGVVLFGACDNGWANGELKTTLPAGVIKMENYSDYDYIEDFSNPVVTCELTDSKQLTNDMLYGTSCSHTDFDESSLPEGSSVILRAKNTDAPTLVRYPYGNGIVIASGLTWEHAYTHREFGPHSYDDLILYALSLSGETFEKPKPISFQYIENEPNQELAEKCALYALLAYRGSKKNSDEKWIAVDEDENNEELNRILASLLQSDGFEDIYTYNCDSKDNKSIKGRTVGVDKKNQGENTICSTMGHRRISESDGEVQDQVVIVFRGTNKAEWYGNFDVTGKDKYDPNIGHHWSFQKAVDDTMGYLADYIETMASMGQLDVSRLSILTTGHSRGASVANLFAHELTNIRNGNPGTEANVDRFQNYTIRSVYAYTFATPNSASYDKIIRDSYEDSDASKQNLNDNIFNFCFTDDFVPNLPLEAWHWGKYGKTYWATAAELDKRQYTSKRIRVGISVTPMIVWEVTSGSDFYYGTKNYFGEDPVYNTKYTQKIAKGAGKLTGKDNVGVQNYYEKQNIYFFGGRTVNGIDLNTRMTPYRYMRDGLGGVMQDDSKGIAIIGGAVNGAYASLSWNFAVGGKVIPALDFAHQPGSYYVAMQTNFRDFEYYELNETGYEATLYSIAEYDNYDMQETHNASQIAALQTFLLQNSELQENGQQLTNADALEWDANNPSTWDGVAWSNGSISGLDLSSDMVAGTLNLSGFDVLEELDVSYNSLTSLVLTGCAALKTLDCSGNQLSALDLTGLVSLEELDCSFNSLSSLDISDCLSLKSLNCNNNELRTLSLGVAQKLDDLSCAYNYLDTSSNALADKINAINQSGGGLVQFLPQNVAEDAHFAENDVACLLSIANYENNNQTLQWDTENPASWDEVSWASSDNTYYLSSVDFRGKNLKGDAVFDGCILLNSILISDNQFKNVSVEDCVSLNTLWCDGNLLNIDTLEEIAASYPDGLNTLLEPQYTPEGIHLADADVSALTNLISAQGLDLRENSLYNYHMLEWTQNGSGVYELTGIDLSSTSVSGELNLSEFTHLNWVRSTKTAVATLVLPDSITSVGANAFQGCASLGEVVFPATLKNIADYAFEDCATLQTVTLPGTLVSIGAHAFENCSKLYLVNFVGAAPLLGQDAFAGCRTPLTLNLRFQVESVELPVDKTYTLSPINFPSGENLTWKSSKPSVATVSENGTITTVSEGTTLITALSDDGFSATCTIIVTAGNVETQKFTITYAPGNGIGTMPSDTSEGGIAFVLPMSTFTPPAGQQFKAWNIGGKEFAPGDSYIFGAHTTITAIYESEGASYTVSVSNGSGAGQYKTGDSVTVVANLPESGMRFKNWKGTSGLNFLNGTDESKSTMIFTMPAENVTLEATYERTTGPCYVATAVYGSYDCPEVWTLRRFRDNVLAKTWYGQLFIRLYYAVSPTAVKLFGNCAWFQNFFRDRLDKMVSGLQEDGFESTPYQDRAW